MRLHFDYNEVSSDVIKLVIDEFYKDYGRDDLQFGSVSVYVTVRRKDDNSSIGWYNKKTGKENELYIKSKPIKGTKKVLLKTIVNDETDDISEEPIAYVYLK